MVADGKNTRFSGSFGTKVFNQLFCDGARHVSGGFFAAYCGRFAPNLHRFAAALLRGKPDLDRGNP